MAAFVIVHAGYYAGLQEKSSKHFTVLVFVFFHGPQKKEIHLLSRFLCYSKLDCLFGFSLLRKATPRDSTKVFVEYAGSVYSRKRGTGKVSDLTYSATFRGCIKVKVSSQLQFLSRFSFVVKSGVIIS